MFTRFGELGKNEGAFINILVGIVAIFVVIGCILFVVLNDPSVPRESVLGFVILAISGFIVITVSVVVKLIFKVIGFD